jgi:hypothetical protein
LGTSQPLPGIYYRHETHLPIQKQQHTTAMAAGPAGLTTPTHVRTRAPPYPRPLSPIDVAECPLTADTVVYASTDYPSYPCEDNDNEEEVDAEAAQRAAKRRKRIRENAAAVQRGEGVVILTAGLKGPFEGGRWRNPWARRRTTKSGKEVPETAPRQGLNAVKPVRQKQTGVVLETAAPARSEVPQRDEAVLAPAHAVEGDEIEFMQPAVVKERPPTNVFKKTTEVGVEVEDVARQHITPTSARRIEDWLRTNDAFKSERLPPDIRSSPTPMGRDEELRLPSPEKQAARPVSADGVGKGMGLGAWADRFSSQKESQQQQQRALAQTNGGESTQQTHESEHRAEAAIIAQKGRSVHRVPPSTNLPAFEYKRAARKATAEVISSRPPKVRKPEGEHVREDQPEKKEADQPSVQSEAQISDPEPTPRTAPEHPALTTETSKATTLGQLPSAQLVSGNIPPDGFSNVQSTAELLQLVKEPTTEETTQQQDQADEKGQSVVKVAISKPDHSEKQDAAATLHTKPPATHQTPVRALDTQALLHNIQPFDMSTVKKIEIHPVPISATATTPVTASKAPTSANMKPLPAPTTKKQPNRTRAAPKTAKKKTSFVNDPASDESQSSIKRGFQVRKTPGKYASPPPPSKIELAAAMGLSTPADDNEEEDQNDGDLDPLTVTKPAAVNGNTHNLRRSAHNKTKPSARAPLRKSILKSRTHPYESSAPACTTQTATGHSLPYSGTNGHPNGTYVSTTNGSPKQDGQGLAQLASCTGMGVTMSGEEMELDMFAIENRTSVRAGSGSGSDEDKAAAGGGEDGLGDGELEDFDMEKALGEIGDYLGAGGWDVEGAVRAA